MSKLSSYEKILEAAAYIRAQSPLVPEVGITLGSGLGGIADHVTEAKVIPYSDIPHFHPTAVEGHKGQLLLGKMNGVPVALLQGRFHFYEGYSMEEVVLPTRTVCALGIHTMVLTNAAGGVNTRFRPGDLMIIEDHINLMTDSPLRGPHLAKLGPRFPDLTEAYHAESVEILKSTAADLKFPHIHSGVYAGLPGPAYETPAEVRMLRTLGADAVGMSTVPESIAANHLGVRVVGISCITNLAAGITQQKLTHKEVMDVSKISSGKLETLLFTVIPKFQKAQKGIAE
jgi:purine-nucleoside phosphorylase